MQRRRILLILLALFFCFVVAPLGIFFFYTRDLPNLQSLADYHPKQMSRVYSDDGELIAQFFVERRTVVGKDKVPQQVLKAFMAAEDAGFYEHQGIDYMGLVRAAIKGVLHGFHFKGTSTITQQLVKTMVTGPERSLKRKIREAVLSTQVEKQLSKDDILNIYLNQIVFGRGNYGIEEACHAYFGKSVSEVDLAEASILAGIPKNPERYNPKADLAAVKERQKYVLDQMVEKGFCSADEAKAAFEEPIKVAKDPFPYLGKAPHFAEVVRRQLEQKYGPDKLYGGGMTIYTTVDAKLQAVAHDAVRAGLRELDKRQGFRGPRVRLEADELAPAMIHLGETFDAKEKAWLHYRGKLTSPLEPLVWDLQTLEHADFQHPERLKDRLTVRELKPDDELGAIVTDIDPTAGTVTVSLGAIKATLRRESYAWARKFNPTQKTPPPRSPTDICRKGDVLIVRVQKVEPAPKDKLDQALKITAALSQEPRVEGSLVAIDPHTRYVRAIVGGDSLEQAGLIRAVQSKRQPGSAFKAIVYTAAIHSQKLTPASLCSDTPVVYRNETTGEAWKPQNFESEEYDGDITLRTALAKSKNTCSVKVADKVGLDEVIAMAKSLGIDSQLPHDLTIALGSGEVTLMELANAYTTLAAQGIFSAPVLVRKVVDVDGQTVLEEHQPEPGEERLPPAEAYIMTKMLEAVIEEGTGQRANALDRPLVGKTGTSSDHRDTWFVGYSPDLVLGTWVGFDDNQMLGPETGASAALPIWINVMKTTPVLEESAFTAPEEGVTQVTMDAKTGLLAAPGAEGSVEMPFLPGTEPTQAASQVSDRDFYEEDGVAPLQKKAERP